MLQEENIMLYSNMVKTGSSFNSLFNEFCMYFVCVGFDDI